MEWRLLPMRVDDAFTSMAIDEAVLRLNSEGESPNTVRFWRWEPSAISLGCFQSLELEVDMEAVEEHGFDVVRRITGGGTVFHDYNGELTYSVVCGEDDVPGDIIESYEKVCGGLVRGFESLGLEAAHEPVNDVVSGGKKVSGSAQTRRWGSALQHGTVLIDPDIRTMFELLEVSPEKISDKFISSVHQRVTSIRLELGRKPGFDEVRDAMAAGFEEEFEVELLEGELSREELELARDLREKYGSRDWLEER